MLKTTVFSEVKKVTKKLRRVDTQIERAELISHLKVILETYKKYNEDHECMHKNIKKGSLREISPVTMACVYKR
jgi:hypothetical protein